MRNWKTTTMGIATILAALASAASALVDSDPKTVPNLEILIGAITAGVGLILAKDFNITGTTTKNENP